MLGTGDSALHVSLPELAFKLEDECQSLLNTPLELPAVDGQSWGFNRSPFLSLSPSPSPLTGPLLDSLDCDSYLAPEDAALFDAYVY
jgi:hypothetical protein